VGVPSQEENEAPLSGKTWRRRGRGEGMGRVYPHQTKGSGGTPPAIPGRSPGRKRL